MRLIQKNNGIIAKTLRELGYTLQEVNLIPPNPFSYIP